VEERQRTPEGFVSAAVAADFLGINRRMLLDLARRGIGGAYPITGERRKRWIFRLSELGIAIDHRYTRPFSDKSRYDPDQGSPR
jgi:hypothetical protein